MRPVRRKKMESPGRRESISGKLGREQEQEENLLEQKNHGIIGRKERRKEGGREERKERKMKVKKYI